jgi:hypothetical protein
MEFAGCTRFGDLLSKAELLCLDLADLDVLVVVNGERRENGGPKDCERGDAHGDAGHAHLRDHRGTGVAL